MKEHEKSLSGRHSKFHQDDNRQIPNTDNTKQYKKKKITRPPVERIKVKTEQNSFNTINNLNSGPLLTLITQQTLDKQTRPQQLIGRHDLACLPYGTTSTISHVT